MTGWYRPLPDVLFKKNRRPYFIFNSDNSLSVIFDVILPL